MNGIELAEGTDYETTYLDNVWPGTAKILIAGIGRYYGVKEVMFKILEQKFDISESDPYFN